ncbi:MAG TPA: hypothetical protein PKX00_20505, partial [Opitutaceae bacterium]|nr:hypothetical protein [Opitutaceae bacterium]
LSDIFAAFGTVESAKVVTDRESGRSKGFGFVEMSTEAEASSAIEKLNGTEQSGRAINVSEAKPMAPREGGGGRGGFDGRPRDGQGQGPGPRAEGNRPAEGDAGNRPYGQGGGEGGRRRRHRGGRGRNRGEFNGGPESRGGGDTPPAN